MMECADFVLMRLKDFEAQFCNISAILTVKLNGEDYLLVPRSASNILIELAQNEALKLCDNLPIIPLDPWLV